MESKNMACPQGGVAGGNGSNGERDINVLALQYVHTKDSTLANLIARVGQKLVRSCARKILFKVKTIAGVEEEDLISSGNMGFLEALSRYNGEVKFTSYAPLRIAGAIKDYLRANTHLGFGRDGREGRVEKHYSLDEEFIASDGASTPLLELIADPQVDLVGSLLEDERRTMLNEAIRYTLDLIPPREAFVLRANIMEDRSLAEIGDQMGTSESRACQLLAQGIRHAQELDAFWDFLDHYPL